MKSTFKTRNLKGKYVASHHCISDDCISRYKLKVNDIKGAKRMISTVAYMCGSVLSEYIGTGNDKDQKFLQTIHVRENVSCSRKTELPYYTVDIYLKICIHYGVSGTSQTHGNSVEYYQKCLV